MVNRSQFIKRFAKNAGFTQAFARDTLDIFFLTMTECILSEEDGVSFGSHFTIKKVVIPETARKNPYNGENIVTPKHYTLRFKPSRIYRADINRMSGCVESCDETLEDE